MDDLQNKQLARGAYMQALKTHPQFDEFVFKPLEKKADEHMTKAVSPSASDGEVRFALGFLGCFKYFEHLFEQAEITAQQIIKKEKRR